MPQRKRVPRPSVCRSTICRIKPCVAAFTFFTPASPTGVLMMRSSKFGVIVLILLTVLGGTSCSYYSRIMARKDLVDGSKAYRDRKFPEAERLFRSAASRDPKGE